MAQIISVQKLRIKEFERREFNECWRKLEKLCLDDLEVFFDFKDYHDGRKDLNMRSRAILISRGIISPEGAISSTMNNVLYEFRYCKQPPWLVKEE